jgi:uncharacterized protein (TIGR03083 family)
MEIATWIESLGREGARMTAAARATPAHAPVPTCPEWVERDLVRHQGGVHRWATSVVAGARAEPPSAGLEEIAGGWPGDEALADWFEAGYLALISALEAAPPDLQCWTFMSAPSPLAFWSRRQAHETTIHRVDAELTAGRSTHHLSSITPDFAADGIDELVRGFWPRLSSTTPAETTVSLGVRCTDDAGAWVVTMRPDGVQTSIGEGEATCTVRGPAADLYLALWNRAGIGSLQIEGDRAALDRFGVATQVRWA